MTAHVFINTYALIMVGLASLAGGITLGLIFQKMRQRRYFGKLADEYCANSDTLRRRAESERQKADAKNEELLSRVHSAMAVLTGASEF